MSRKNEHFFNVSRNCYIERTQAMNRIGLNMDWVQEGVSVRELSLAEMVALRSQEARSNGGRGPLGRAELSHCIWEPPERDRYTQGERQALVWQAYQFYRDPIVHA